MRLVPSRNRVRTRIYTRFHIRCKKQWRWKERRGSEMKEEMKVSRRSHGTAIFQARRPPTRGRRGRDNRPEKFPAAEINWSRGFRMPLWIRGIVFESWTVPMLVNNRGGGEGEGVGSHEAHPNALSSLAGERGHACVREANATPVAQCPWSWTAMNVGIKWL